jgi:hypothetical protein
MTTPRWRVARGRSEHPRVPWSFELTATPEEQVDMRSKLTPEERAVFNRVVANELEIARLTGDYDPVLSPDELQRIAELGRGAHLSSEERRLFLSACRKLVLITGH